jgi:pyruvate ferredoxin oxidoreductase alpha subunit
MPVNKKMTKEGGTRILDGNHAAAQGVKLSRAQVIAAYPITPQSPVTERLSEFVEAGGTRCSVHCRRE